jgi:hypothetical protein
MNLSAKNIQVGLNKVRANLSQNTIQDLKSLDSMFYEYKYNDVDETLIISKYFDMDYIEGDYIYFTINDKMLRKIKLLIISKHKESEVLKK